MRSLAAIVHTTLITLRRDHIFVPAVIAGGLIMFFAMLASDWGIEEFFKILYDIANAGFHFTGSVVALFWGIKVLSDSKQEGSIEIVLASPIRRSVFVIGRYVGLCLTLVLFAIILVALLQVAMLVFNYGWLHLKHLIIFGFYLVNWLLVAATSIFFATFCTQGVALFSCACLWLNGLAVQSIYQALSPETQTLLRFVIHLFLKVWNLQLFNLGDYAIENTFVTSEELLWRLSYGAGLILILLTISCLIFRKKDLMN